MEDAIFRVTYRVRGRVDSGGLVHLLLSLPHVPAEGLTACGLRFIDVPKTTRRKMTCLWCVARWCAAQEE